MSDMFFDTDSFDFASIQDIVGLNGNEGKNTATDKTTISNNARNNRDEVTGFSVENDDIDDLFPRSTGGEETEKDLNSDVSDLEQGMNERTGFNFTDAFRSADDNAIIDFEGLTLTKAELKELYKSKTKVDHDSAYFAEQAQRFDEDNRMINQRFLMQSTVLENNINILTQRLNNPNLDNNTYAETSRQLQQQQLAHQQLTNEVNQIMQTRANQEQLVNGYRIRAADQELSQLYPEWNRYKTDVLSYAQEQGISGAVLEKVYDKPLMSALLKAYLYDANKKRVQSEVEQRTSQARNARSTTGAKQSSRNAKADEEFKAKAKQAINKMGGDRNSNIRAFDYLID